MENLLTNSNLMAGIHLWRTQKTHWPGDFHNEFYQELSCLRQNGLNGDWWWQIVRYLAGWRALRPLAKGEIYTRGVERLGQLQVAYNQIIESNDALSIDLTTAVWEPLNRLYSVAFEIKDVNSPVFGSKLCHFILPNAFPVIDHAVIGIKTRSYHEYWQFCKTQ